MAAEVDVLDRELNYTTPRHPVDGYVFGGLLLALAVGSLTVLADRHLPL